MSDGTVTRFIASIVGYVAKGKYVRVHFRAPADQLMRAVHLISFTGGGQPREFLVKVAYAVGEPHIAFPARLHQFNVDWEGYVRGVFEGEVGKVPSSLMGLLDKNVALECADA